MFIKIDTQGAEFEVLSGLGEFRHTGRISFVTEFSPLSIRPRIPPVKFLRILAKDFELFELDRFQKTVGVISTGDFETMIERISAQRHPYCDIAGVPRRSPMREALENTLLN